MGEKHPFILVTCNINKSDTPATLVPSKRVIIYVLCHYYGKPFSCLIQQQLELAMSNRPKMQIDQNSRVGKIYAPEKVQKTTLLVLECGLIAYPAASWSKIVGSLP